MNLAQWIEPLSAVCGNPGVYPYPGRNQQGVVTYSQSPSPWKVEAGLEFKVWVT